MSDSFSNASLHRAILWAAALAKASAPTAQEQLLLAGYARGQVLDEPVQHVLYCSQATRPFGEYELIALLEQARAYNLVHQLTGLLCYEAGHFVQVIEGAPAAVTQLFARIERDPRHRHVRVLSTGHGPLRQFADWRLARAGTHPAEFYWLTSYLEARRHQLLVPQIPVPEPELITLLDTLSHTCGEDAQLVDTPGMLGDFQPDGPAATSL